VGGVDQGAQMPEANGTLVMFFDIGYRLQIEAKLFLEGARSRRAGNRRSLLEKLIEREKDTP
jgi:hypothetical protein